MKTGGVKGNGGKTKRVREKSKEVVKEVQKGNEKIARESQGMEKKDKSS